MEYLNPDNHLLFQLSEGSLQSFRMVKREKTPINKKSVEKLAVYTVRIEFQADSIVHKVKKGAVWQIVEIINGANFGKGKFGFLIPENQEVMLKDFTFEPQ